jgi:hypothetical protein
MLTTVFRLSGHASGGPSGVDRQSWEHDPCCRLCCSRYDYGRPGYVRFSAERRKSQRKARNAMWSGHWIGLRLLYRVPSIRPVKQRGALTAATETLGKFDLARSSVRVCRTKIGTGDVQIPRKAATCGETCPGWGASKSCSNSLYRLFT